MMFALTVELWLFRLLAIAAFCIELWALVDVLRRPADAFLRVGGRTRSFWLVLTGAAALVGLTGVLLPGGGLGILGMAAVCISCVYLAGPRTELRLFGGR